MSDYPSALCKCGSSYSDLGNRTHEAAKETLRYTWLWWWIHEKSEFVVNGLDYHGIYSMAALAHWAIRHREHGGFWVCSEYDTPDDPRRELVVPLTGHAAVAELAGDIFSFEEP